MFKKTFLITKLPYNAWTETTKAAEIHCQIYDGNKFDIKAHIIHPGY